MTEIEIPPAVLALSERDREPFIRMLTIVHDMTETIKQLNEQLAISDSKLWEATERYQKFAKNLIEPREAEIERIKTQLAATNAVIETWRKYMTAHQSPDGGGCPRSLDSGSHEDHVCVVSLRGQFYRAMAQLDSEHG